MSEATTPKKPSDTMFGRIWDTLPKWAQTFVSYLGGIILLFAFFWNGFLTPKYQEKILGIFFEKDINKLWWNELSFEWKQLLLSSAECTPTLQDDLTNDDFEKIYNLGLLNLENKKIENLKPLSIGKFHKLNRIQKGACLSSINGIKHIKTLIHLDIDNSQVKDISELYSLGRIKSLTLVNTKIEKKQIDSLKLINNEIQIRQ